MNIRRTTKYTKSENVAVITGALICSLFAPAISQSADDWVEIKNPAELRAIYSNKTWEGEGLSIPYHFVSYYSADGKGVVIHEGKTTPRSWVVKNDRVCASTATRTRCSVFWRKRDNRNEIKGMNIDNGFTFTAKIKEGIPKF